MKPKLISYLIAITIMTISLSVLQSCKDNAVVETPPATNQNPEVPQLISPVNEGTINFFTPTIDWHDFQGAVNYRIQISLDANFSGTMIMDSSGITASQLHIATGLFTTNSYYYWRVKASLSSGATPWSGVWRFRIILNPPPAPNLISPLNGAINQPYTPLMDWNESSTAEFYRIQIATNPGFATLVIDSSRIPVTQYQVPEFALTVNTQYFWRVNASNSGGASTSPWSAPWSFTVMNGPQPNSISGTITFVDTNFSHSPDGYKVGAFNGWPPFSPFSEDSLIITHIGNLYTANYKITRLPSGDYNVAVYPNLFSNPEIRVLGIYGCDTVHVEFSNCPQSPSTVSIINGWGVEGINFLSWADTTKRIF
jgi:hypothetical protein